MRMFMPRQDNFFINHVTPTYLNEKNHVKAPRFLYLEKFKTPAI